MPKNNHPQVECDACSGTGVAPLSDKLWATLKDVRAHPNTTPLAIWLRLKLRGNPTTLNGRLAKLLALDLVTRKKNSRGKGHVYTAKSKP